MATIIEALYDDEDALGVPSNIRRALLQDMTPEDKQNIAFQAGLYGGEVEFYAEEPRWVDIKVTGVEARKAVGAYIAKRLAVPNPFL